MMAPVASKSHTKEDKLRMFVQHPSLRGRRRTDKVHIRHWILSQQGSPPRPPAVSPFCQMSTASGVQWNTPSGVKMSTASGVKGRPVAAAAAPSILPYFPQQPIPLPVQAAHHHRCRNRSVSSIKGQRHHHQDQRHHHHRCQKRHLQASQKRLRQNSPRLQRELSSSRTLLSTQTK